MDAILIEFAKSLWAKSDPLLIVCILVLAYWQRKTSAALDKHLNPDPRENPWPHPQCQAHGQSFIDLRATMEKHHQETREDIRGLSERIETALKIASRE